MGEAVAEEVGRVAAGLEVDADELALDVDIDLGYAVGGGSGVSLLELFGGAIDAGKSG